MNRLVAGAALSAFLVAMLAIAITSATSGGGSSPAGTATGATNTAAQPTRPATTVSRPRTVPVKLTAVGAYDPEGDGRENDDLAPLAVDGNPSTFWKTEHYTSGFFKKGVGLVLDAGRRTAISRVTVSTDGSGSSAQIQLGDSSAGPFHAVSADRPLTGTTKFPLAKGAAGRYLVIWVTALPQALGEVHITEVRATRKLP
jgi:hypothetical protein